MRRPSCRVTPDSVTCAGVVLSFPLAQLGVQLRWCNVPAPCALAPPNDVHWMPCTDSVPSPQVRYSSVGLLVTRSPPQLSTRSPTAAVVSGVVVSGVVVSGVVVPGAEVSGVELDGTDVLVDRDAPPGLDAGVDVACVDAGGAEAE